MRGLIFALAVAVIGVLAACETSFDLDKPPEMHYSQDVCESCGMVIDQARYAAAYVTELGVAHRFDDIGEMMDYNRQKQESVAVYWVHDFQTEEWIKGTTAYFVVTDALVTPMDHGVVAIGERGRADALAAATHGEVVDFDEMRSRVGEHAGHASTHAH